MKFNFSSFCRRTLLLQAVVHLLTPTSLYASEQRLSDVHAVTMAHHRRELLSSSETIVATQYTASSAGIRNDNGRVGSFRNGDWFAYQNFAFPDTPLDSDYFLEVQYSNQGGKGQAQVLVSEASAPLDGAVVATITPEATASWDTPDYKAIEINAASLPHLSGNKILVFKGINTEGTEVILNLWSFAFKRKGAHSYDCVGDAGCMGDLICVEINGIRSRDCFRTYDGTKLIDATKFVQEVTMHSTEGSAPGVIDGNRVGPLMDTAAIAFENVKFPSKPDNMFLEITFSGAADASGYAGLYALNAKGRTVSREGGTLIANIQAENTGGWTTPTTKAMDIHADNATDLVNYQHLYLRGKTETPGASVMHLWSFFIKPKAKQGEQCVGDAGCLGDIICATYLQEPKCDIRGVPAGQQLGSLALCDTDSQCGNSNEVCRAGQCQESTTPTNPALVATSLINQCRYVGPGECTSGTNQYDRCFIRNTSVDACRVRAATTYGVIGYSNNTWAGQSNCLLFYSDGYLNSIEDCPAGTEYFWNHLIATGMPDGTDGDVAYFSCWSCGPAVMVNQCKFLAHGECTSGTAQYDRCHFGRTPVKACQELAETTPDVVGFSNYTWASETACLLFYRDNHLKALADCPVGVTYHWNDLTASGTPDGTDNDDLFSCYTCKPFW